MAIKTVTVSGYELYSSFDRDHTVHAHTEDKKVAKAWKEQSPYNDFSEIERTFFFIESLMDMKELEQQKKIQAALRKLTPEEKRLLGLTCSCE